jgi:hypothetical protein
MKLQQPVMGTDQLALPFVEWKEMRLNEIMAQVSFHDSTSSS